MYVFEGTSDAEHSCCGCWIVKLPSPADSKGRRSCLAIVSTSEPQCQARRWVTAFSWEEQAQACEPHWREKEGNGWEQFEAPYLLWSSAMTVGRISIQGIYDGLPLRKGQLRSRQSLGKKPTLCLCFAGLLVAKFPWKRQRKFASER